MNAIECSGKTVQEAVSKALAQSGWSLGEIEYEVLQEASKGILGIGAKPVVVRVTLTEDEKVPAAKAQPPERRQAEPKRAESKQQAEPKQNARRVEERAPKQDRGEGKPRREEDKPAAESKVAKALKGEPVDAPSHPAGQFLAKLLPLMQVEPELRMSKADDVLYVDVLSENMSDMIGQRGETLDAIQYITSLVVNKGEHEYTRVMLDTHNYRKKREATLQNLARRLAARAKQSGKRIVLEPMNPYERRVMHATLQNNQYVKTRSEGVEPNRRVIIEPVAPQAKE